MSVVVVATVNPKPANRAEVIAAFESVIVRVHAEDPGCELYALHETDGDTLIMIEKWTSVDALGAHGRSAALRELGGALAGKLAAEVNVQVLTPHPAGTAELGTL